MRLISGHEALAMWNQPFELIRLDTVDMLRMCSQLQIRTNPRKSRLFIKINNSRVRFVPVRMGQASGPSETSLKRQPYRINDSRVRFVFPTFDVSAHSEISWHTSFHLVAALVI